MSLLLSGRITDELLTRGQVVALEYDDDPDSPTKRVYVKILRNPTVSSNTITIPVDIEPESDGLGETVEKVMDVPPAGWEKLADDMGDDTFQAQADLCNCIAYLGRAYGYFNARSLNLDHKGSVKHSNKFIARLRKVLGFAYPKDDLNF